MPAYRSVSNFKHGSPHSIGILVVNLGTPKSPTTGDVRRFLREFLSDPRVIEYPRLLWWLILNLIILVIRPSRSAANYRKIWTDQGSPLMVFSQAIVSELRKRMAASKRDDIHVELAMTYGDPSVSDAVKKLTDQGARRILTIPLYPQYSGTTTGAVFDTVNRALAQQRWIPESRFVTQYHDTPLYIAALAKSIEDYWQENGRGDKLLMSFHGVPTSTLKKGDPYFCQCQKTGRLIAEALGLSDDEWLLSFQSRVGREEWLSPYTETTVNELGASGLGRLDVVCPGFATDCLETLEEIEMQNAEFFVAAGGKELRYIPSLNANPAHIDALQDLIESNIGGWEHAVTDEQAQQRAMTLGAEA